MEADTTQHCECGSEEYHIKQKVDDVGSSGVLTWAECVECGRPTRTLGEGVEMLRRWLNDD